MGYDFLVIPECEMQQRGESWTVFFGNHVRLSTIGISHSRWISELYWGLGQGTETGLGGQNESGETG